MDRGVWQATVQGGPKELDTPKRLSTQINVHKILNNILQNERLNYTLISMSILADVLCNNIYISNNWSGLPFPFGEGNGEGND